MKKRSDTNPFFALPILCAAVSWASLGLFSHHFTELGLTPLQISVIRLVVAAPFFWLILFCADRRACRIRLRDLPWFFATGVGGVFMMCAFYFASVSASSMATAAILVYTAPFLVLGASVLWFGEAMTRVKVISLVVAFTGCILVAGTGKANVVGILTGVMSGICYASYSIFSTVLLKKGYSSLTVTAYSFVFAAAAALLFGSPVSLMRTLLAAPQPQNWLWCAGTAFFTALLPFSLYTLGLQHTPAGKASVIAFAEPMAASVFGWLFLQETLNLFSIFGIFLILFALILLNFKDIFQKK